MANKIAFAPDNLAEINAKLEKLSAEERIAWAMENIPGNHALSSSFGAQSAVSLHLATQAKPDIPVILVDTGYLFPETYDFIEEMTERLKLNLKTYRNEMSPAWQERKFGKLWTQGKEGIVQYNQMNKVEPMKKALQDLDISMWMAGLRRGQSSTRAHLPVLTEQNGRWKLHPIIDWTDYDIYQYLKKNQLPYHPLWHQGYVSIGDIHTTRTLAEAGSEEATRFFGLKRECGLHEVAHSEQQDNEEEKIAMSGC